MSGKPHPLLVSDSDGHETVCRRGQMANHVLLHGAARTQALRLEPAERRLGRTARTDPLGMSPRQA
jgi:hypothetical protein